MNAVLTLSKEEGKQVSIQLFDLKQLCLEVIDFQVDS
jgi:hypothetical protein